MSGFAPLFYFLITVLVLREGMAFGRANKPENEPRMGIIGAIIDNSSRIGKEERVAIEMAVEDFHATGNQRLALHIRNSQREDPLQAALAGRRFPFLIN